MNSNYQKAVKILKQDGVVVLPTDTLYGIVASALSKKAVEKMYKVRDRDKDKPCILLIINLKQLESIGVKVSNTEILEKYWPGKVSFVLPCQNNKFKYLHRGTKSIAVRMIRKRNKNLFDLISKIGPIIAPSANIQSYEPAKTIKEAKFYFKDNVDLYIDGGRKVSKASTLVSLLNKKVEILRQGQVKIKP